MQLTPAHKRVGSYITVVGLRLRRLENADSHQISVRRVLEKGLPHRHYVKHGVSIC